MTPVSEKYLDSLTAEIESLLEELFSWSGYVKKTKTTTKTKEEN